ncbi:MAG: hypothetical protein H7Z13_20075 [Ferruginibacter sp.]|nr:hypothetical protein [Ferruginibacter sp.]
MRLVILFLISFYGFTTVAQNSKSDTAKRPADTKIQVVEAACGQCKFGLPGKSCDLAIRINGQSYFVDGTNINSHGDAHAPDGFCNATRKAEVRGAITGKRFKASYFKLLPDLSKKPEGN